MRGLGFRDARGACAPLFLLLRVNRCCDFSSDRQRHLRLVHRGGADRCHDLPSGHLLEYFRPVDGPVKVVIGGDGDFYPGINPLTRAMGASLPFRDLRASCSRVRQGPRRG